MYRLLLAVCGLILSFSVAAETRWVTDLLTITVRSGPGTEYSIRKTVKSGQPLRVVQRDTGAGWTRVRAGGTEGWVLTRYLLKSPAARQQLKSIKQRLEQLESENKRLTGTFDQLSSERNSLDEQRGGLQSTNAELAQRVEELMSMTANTRSIKEKNDSLSRSNNELRNEVSRLKLELQDKSSEIQRDWFVIGGVTILISLLLGALIPRIRWQRRSSWGDPF